MSKIEDLEQIKQSILANLKCPLKDAATNLVFGKGNPDAPILFIGEAPGEQEDLLGLPFVGRAGKELDILLQSIGLALDKCYVANILKYRPPQNRNPSMDEIRNHTPYLIEQIKVIKPKVVATLGNFSTKFVLADFNPDKMKHIGGISFLHGKSVEKEISGLKFKVIPLYHPAACLYNPKLKADLQEDFKRIREVL